MDAVNVLLYATSLEHRMNAASTIITRYNLHFSVDDIIKAFDTAQNYGSSIRWSLQNLMILSLTTNLRMFIALIYSLLDDKKLDYACMIWRAHHDNIVLGCRFVADENVKYSLETWSAKQP